MSKLCILTFIFFGILCPPTFRENVVETRSGGTIVMFYDNPDKAFVAADSRFYDPSHPNIKDNSGCKIISLSNRNIFFYSGGLAQVKTTVSNKVLVSANILALRAFQETSHLSDPYSQLYETARHWGALMKPTADEILKVIPRDRKPDEVQLGGFVGLDGGGTPKMIFVNMSVTVFNDNRPSISDFQISEAPGGSNRLLGFGGVVAARDNAMEFIKGVSSRAKQANIVFENSFRNKPINDHDNYLWVAAIESAVRWTRNEPRVGGKVDAVVLEKGRDIRWIQRKQNCYQEDATH